MSKTVKEFGKRLAKAEVLDGIGMEECERRLLRQAKSIADTYGYDVLSVARRLRVWRDRYHAAYCFC